MSNTLLPCPFCGGAKLEVSNKTTTISFVRKRHVAVYCKKCNTYGPRIIADETRYPEFCTEEAKQEAIAAWNRRSDAVPVVRGEWVTIGMRPAGTKDTHYCSVCKGHGRNEMNHCPHCGADMRGESEGST